MATYFLMTDRQRSVLPGLHAYSPYGFMGADPVLALGFCGQRPDPFTGNYPLGNGRRFYSPTLMRFMTPDSISPFSRGGINGYAYCGGDPVNRHDPSGAFWSVILRAIGVMSSTTTLTGAVVRTMKNVVGRRAAFHASNGGREPIPTHNELPNLSRISNQHLSVTGSLGIAGQVTAAVTGVTPGTQTVVDFLNIGNAVTNISGGVTGNLAAGREVVSYLRTYPREIPVVALETVMDLMMLDEIFSTIGRGFIGAANRIRSLRPRAHEVQV